MVRIGVAAALSSSILQQCQAVGVMVTASHNDESYIGVKLADPTVGMMSAAGEDLAMELDNIQDTEVLCWRIKELQGLQQSLQNTESTKGITLHFQPLQCAYRVPVVQYRMKWRFGQKGQWQILRSWIELAQEY
jgi:hypothetical protein